MGFADLFFPLKASFHRIRTNCSFFPDYFFELLVAFFLCTSSLFHWLVVWWLFLIYIFLFSFSSQRWYESRFRQDLLLFPSLLLPLLLQLFLRYIFFHCVVSIADISSIRRLIPFFFSFSGFHWWWWRRHLLRPEKNFFFGATHLSPFFESLFLPFPLLLLSDRITTHIPPPLPLLPPPSSFCSCKQRPPPPTPFLLLPLISRIKKVFLNQFLCLFFLFFLREGGRERERAELESEADVSHPPPPPLPPPSLVGGRKGTREALFPSLAFLSTFQKGTPSLLPPALQFPQEGGGGGGKKVYQSKPARCGNHCLHSTYRNAICW